MIFDIASIDIGSMVDFVMKNLEEIGLLIFATVQCFLCTRKLLFSKGSFGFVSSKFSSFLWDAMVYYPTLGLVVANLFFNTSWRLLTGYLLGVSLQMLLSLGREKMAENKGPDISDVENIEEIKWRFKKHEERSKKTGEVLAKAAFTFLVCLSLIFN